MAVNSEKVKEATLATLPGDDVRQIMWRFADRDDLQGVVQSVRSVARGIVARLVADGERSTHDWTKKKDEMLPAFDQAGITALSIEPEYGGSIEGPKNLALALAAFEMAWVDGGAATSSLAGHLALGPIHERGTQEQWEYYATRCVPPQPGEDREVWRGAFALTEPLPYVGVDTRVLSGTVRIEKWDEGEEPTLKVDKRGRFITAMGYANFVVAAVHSVDERIKGSCMVILEETDPGLYDRGAPTRKLVHQLSSTHDPVLSLEVPTGRIIGGYAIKDGTIIPNYDHSEIIRAVFRRTRVTVGLMTSAKLLSAIEPVIRYHRERYRGGTAGQPGTPRYEMGLQQKEDVLHRLVDIWATGEASASLGFAAARLFDAFDPLESKKDEVLTERGIEGGRAQYKAMKQVETDAVEYLKLSAKLETERDQTRFEELEKDFLVQYARQDVLANVLCPATKLWNTGHGANMMREAVSLMGGYGITEDCPGFLGQKWMDAQLEATYEGPEAVQRRQLAIMMTNEVFLTQFKLWIREMRHIAGERPGTGACTVASSMELWLWTLRHLLDAKDADGKDLFRDQRQGITFPMADALCWLLASRYQILDLIELDEKGQQNPALADALPGFVHFFTDLCHVQAARAAGEASRTCAGLAFGYNRHPSWDREGKACFRTDDLVELEAVMPGIEAGVGGAGDVIESDGSHAHKAGPCVNFTGMDTFVRLRGKLDGCLSGSGLAKDRAAQAIAHVMIPEDLDYPQ